MREEGSVTSRQRRTAASLVVFLVFVALAGQWARPTAKLSDTKPSIQLDRAIPLAFGDWRVDPNVVPISPSPALQAELAQTYDQIVDRTYVNGRGEVVMLSIAYGSAQTKQLRAHRQEFCYRAQGFEIQDLHVDSMTIAGRRVELTRMFATAGARSEPVSYWFTMGDEVVRTLRERQMAQLKFTLAGVIPDGYLVRVSSLGSNQAVEFERQQRFTQDLFRAIPTALRIQLIGRS